MVRLPLSRRLTVKLARLRGVEPPPVYTRDVLTEYPVGVGTYGVPRIHNYPKNAGLSIGAYCSIAAEVEIFLGGEHNTDWVTTFPMDAMWPDQAHAGHPKTRGDVRIGNDVWIGRGATIMSGVTVGDGAVIAAKALVVKDVAPYTIVGGNPAKPIRAPFAPEIVEQLRAIRWWDWPPERVRAAAPLLQSPDIAGFIRAVEEGRA